MQFNGWGSFEDLARACGYTISSDNSSNNKNNIGCNDIPNGFQPLHPELFIIIGEILGNIIAGSIPSNVQNSLGNWFELVGQAILTYNAQQQYFESGPGGYFSPRNFNASNPLCNTNSTNNSSNSKSNDINKDKIQELEKQVQQLINKINKIEDLLKK